MHLSKYKHVVRCKVCLEDIWATNVTPLEGVRLVPDHFNGYNGYPEPDPVVLSCPNCQQVPFVVDQSGQMFMFTNEGQLIPEYQANDDARFMLRNDF